MVDWTAERIAALPIEQVKVLRDNALRCGDGTIAALCEEAIGKRTPARKREPQRAPRIRPPAASHAGQVVVGFHFVCPQEKGITRNEDGTIWTGTWVVAPVHAEFGSKSGAYVALHASKAEPSYVQGTICDWRRSKRDREYVEDRPVRTEFGIDFLLQPTDEPYEWQGDGAGEKGYVWSPTG
jgi:hypothetical protein